MTEEPDWIPFTDDGIQPAPKQLIDIIFMQDDEDDDEEIWMICSCYEYMKVAYTGVPTHWRPAERLPKEYRIKYFGEKE